MKNLYPKKLQNIDIQVANILAVAIKADSCRKILNGLKSTKRYKAVLLIAIPTRAIEIKVENCFTLALESSRNIKYLLAI